MLRRRSGIVRFRAGGRNELTDLLNAQSARRTGWQRDRDGSIRDDNVVEQGQVGLFMGGPLVLGKGNRIERRLGRQAPPLRHGPSRVQHLAIGRILPFTGLGSISKCQPGPL